MEKTSFTSTKHNTEPSKDPTTASNVKNLQSIIACASEPYINYAI